MDLPTATPPQNLSRPRKSDLPAAKGETIIVVEDDEMIRSLSTQILGSLGYKVIAACDGAVAYEMASEFPDRVDLVFSDVVMPKCDGPEFVSRLRQVRDDFKVLYTSGYTRDAFAVHDEEKEAELLSKPFTPHQLAERVRMVLDEFVGGPDDPAQDANRSAA